eukprot:6440952-Amphidinium_carterae.4
MAQLGGLAAVIPHQRHMEDPVQYRAEVAAYINKARMQLKRLAVINAADAWAARCEDAACLVVGNVPSQMVSMPFAVSERGMDAAAWMSAKRIPSFWA